MKKLTILLLISFSIILHGQNFTWMKGPNTAGNSAITGTMGLASPANNPGERHGCAKWTDHAGNLWFFGGEGPQNSWWNDLWKYDIASNEWTWVRGSTTTTNNLGVYGTMGVASPTNEPGSREFPASWVDAAGDLWMFGGDGFATSVTFGRLGDLWKYNIASNQWTWVRGFNTTQQNGIYGTQGVPSSSNDPGCRYGAGVCTDASGNFWMFGGRGLGSIGTQGYVSDLWKYNPSTNQWTWISGPNITNQFGAYGTLGTPSTSNGPGGRYFPACWIDASNNIFLFGGYGFPTVNSTDYMNDLWKFDPTANTWVWINGPNTTNGLAVYGTLGVSASSVIPGSRMSQATWTDGSGNFWLFGGHGWSTTTVTGHGSLNDMFRYNPASNEWTWMKGSNLQNQNGIYGTQGVTAATNMPGAREYNTWWRDLTGRFWLFGGEGYDISNTSTNHMSDLWVYSIPCSPDSLTASGGKNLCTGVAATFSAASSGGSTVWYSSPTSTISIASGPTVSLPASYTTATAPTVYTLYASANNCTTAPRASITITINPAPTLTVTASSSTICSGQSSTLSASGASIYSWTGGGSFTSTIPSPSVSPTTTTHYTVIGTDVNGCKDTTEITVSVNALPTLTISATQKTICIHHTATLTATGATSYTWDATSVSHTLAVSPTVTTTYTVMGTDANGCVGTLTVTEKVDLCTGIQVNNAAALQCIIFPNPSKGTFNIKTQTEFTGAKFKITNALGQKVFEQIFDSGQATINTNLPSGIYYYEIKTGNSAGTGKLVIE